MAVEQKLVAMLESHQAPATAAGSGATAELQHVEQVNDHWQHHSPLRQGEGLGPSRASPGCSLLWGRRIFRPTACRFA
jgi:hypothetical protein